MIYVHYKSHEYTSYKQLITKFISKTALKMIALVLVIVTLVTLYLYGTSTFKYWEKRGVKHDKPIPLFGNNFKWLSQQRSITEIATDLYWKYPKEKVVGFYRSIRRELLIRDPAIVKRVLVSDFNHFVDRGLVSHRDVEPLLRNLFFVDGDVWRLLRQRMTPAFTSGKLKAMFPLIVERAEKLQGRILDAAVHDRPLDARDLMARYTTDFIGAVGFGLNSDSLNDENSQFRKLGAEIFKVHPAQAVLKVITGFFPYILTKVRVLYNIEKQIVQLVKHIMKERNYQASGRNDFIDLMLECQQKGVMEGESMETFKPDGTPEKITLELTDELIAAQVFIFFAAGFETSSSATSFTLHQLAYNPEIQKKVHADIDKVLAKYNDKLSYDAIKEMTYLDWSFKEAMRMFPSLGFLMRRCVHKYTIPEVDVTIDEGVNVMIPLQAMQNDPQYFDEPHEFRPERFNPENMNEVNKYVYLPFGTGPRACIGERLGQMQSLAGLAAVLSRFSVEPCPLTVQHPAVDPISGIVQIVKGGLPLYFRERKIEMNRQMS